MSRSVILGSFASRFSAVFLQRNAALSPARFRAGPQLRPLASSFYSSFSNNEHDSSLQGHQEHEFSPSRSREILSAQVVCETGNVDVAQELANQSPTHVREEGEPVDRPYDAQGSVSLYGVMQTNVPEPYRANDMGNPTHVNMPGGGFMRNEKYVSDRYIHGTHPKRSYSTRAIPDNGSMQGAQDIYTDVFSPSRPDAQGIQGEECVSFRLWLQNCAFYGLDCDRQANEYIEGRRTLKDIFAEQEQLIDEVVSLGRRRAMESEAGVQGAQDYEYLRMIEAIQVPCPQGVQGESCEQFKVWLQNCGKYGTGVECEKAYRAVMSGRKTLHQLFEEQEALINQVQKRHYTTSPPPADKQEVENVSPAARLKKAVKEYGSTVVVFHVCISLVSLGGFYMAVSSGLDVVSLLHKLGVGETILQSRLTAGASTFVIAYAVHKVFAPARIACTLTCTPFIVRYLRRIGFLKKPVAPK